MSGYAALAFLTPILAWAAGFAGELRIVARCLEHPDDVQGEGHMDRTAADCDAVARRAEGLDANIVAFKEAGYGVGSFPS